MTDTPIINGVQPPFLPIGGIEALRGKKTAEVFERDENSFQAVLEKELRTVKFSAHASERLKSRNIEFSDAEMEKLENAVTRAEEKGSRESLVMMNNLALIVSVKNRTVVTAMDKQMFNHHVFTNIDSVVFA
jgi:flagellar operon protein